MRRRVRWITIGEGNSQRNDAENHGTCVLAWAASPLYGVAKKAKIVLVKLPLEPSEVDPGEMGADMEGILEALQAVINDVKRRKFRGKAVVNLSWTSK
jgi:hypothetical protein